jgi:hypothetical protein
MRYAPGMPGLPVITLISDSTGVALPPAEELRFGTGFSVESVTGDGPTRVEVSTPTLGLPILIQQPRFEDSENFACRVILAVALDAPAHIGRIALMLTSSTEFSETNYAEFNVYEVDTDGAQVGSSLWTFGTNVSDLSELSAQNYLVADRDLPIGHTLYAEWVQHGSGTTIAGGAWIIT